MGVYKKCVFMIDDFFSYGALPVFDVFLNLSVLFYILQINLFFVLKQLRYDSLFSNSGIFVYRLHPA